MCCLSSCDSPHEVYQSGSTNWDPKTCFRQLHNIVSGSIIWDSQQRSRRERLGKVYNYRGFFLGWLLVDSRYKNLQQEVCSPKRVTRIGPRGGLMVDLMSIVLVIPHTTQKHVLGQIPALCNALLWSHPRSTPGAYKKGAQSPFPLSQFTRHQRFPPHTSQHIKTHFYQPISRSH